MFLNIYRHCFSRVFIFSPSINVDATWAPVKEYIEKEMNVKRPQDEPIYSDRYNPEALLKIITAQHKVLEFQKKQKHKKSFSVLVIVDDFADDPSVSRQSKLLHALYTRGRHNSV